MSRERLRNALAGPTPEAPAIVPLIEAHAARLEQLHDDRWPADPEAQARMFRAAQALYDLDAVTVGGSGIFVATACWLAVTPAMGTVGARAAVIRRQTLPRTPPPADVAGTPAITLARDVVGRLRPVLGERSGLAVVLPDAARLATLLGRGEDRAWAAEVSTEVVRALGEDEPDLFLLTGDDPLDPTLESLGDFFGVPILPIGASAPPGLVALAPEALLEGSESPRGWLYTTRSEVEPGTDPGALRAALARLRHT